MGVFDVVVLGGGTAGVHVATEVARGGKSVALVEAGLIGGESPYLADVPANSLLLAARRGEAWEDAVARRDEVTGSLDDAGAEQRLVSADVTVIRGTGRIASPGTVSVSAPVGASVSLSYSDLVIATGCEPVAPPIEGLSDIPAWTTAQGLCSPDLPRRLIVLGGGAAGCELAQIYAAFGSQVTLIEAEAGLLPGEAAFAGEILAAALRRAGVEIVLGSRATKAERTPDGLTLALADGARIDADRLLLATGRRPRLGGLGLDALGITAAPGQPLPMTASCQVAGTRGVWAAGDVTGTTHTHASRYQAGGVAANIAGAGQNSAGQNSAGQNSAGRNGAGRNGAGRPLEADYTAIPRCVFTMPSVYAVGEPAQPGFVTARVRLSEVTRGRLRPDDLGCLELYADGGVLVGAVAVGPDAADWMAEVTLAIRARIPVTLLADVVHAFPTYGEALQAAFRELAGTGQKEKGIGPLSELDLETPEDDAIEQHQEVVAEEAVTVPGRDLSFDVNEADAAEQARAVGFDDDDYR
jgi:pyruvate/2-oxoglutarate dehydrogenase complex dihydrolipoamide dehydrogenase (E3) component